jgi:uncharacterized protein YbjT (DUF2867 family)
MKILIAGASGAIGRPLVRSLKENRHDVFVLARSPKSAKALAETGAEPVSADALEAASVNEAVKRIRRDAVINELTAEDCLPDELDRWVRDTRTQFTKAGICRAPALPLRFGTTSAD